MRSFYCGQVKRTSETIIQEIYDSPPKIAEFLGSVEERIFKLGNDLITNSTVHISAPVEEASTLDSQNDQARDDRCRSYDGLQGL